MNTEFGLYLVEQVERVFALAVHLVDEHHHRRLAHTANLHQTPRLRLHTLGGINHNDDRIHRRQRAESVLRKVLMPRGIEDIDVVSYSP